MGRRVVDARPFLFGFLLKGLPGNVLDKIAGDTYKKILLNDLTRAHAFAEHEELSLILVLYIIRQEDDPKIVDPALDFGLRFLEVKQLVNVLHLRYGLLAVADDDDLVILCGQDPFHGSYFVKLGDFFFYIYHI